MIDQTQQKLSRNSAEGAAETLRMLISELGARGGGVGMMKDGGCPHILFTCGEPARVTTRVDIYEFFRGCWDDERGVGTARATTIEGQPRFACVALSRSDDELLLLTLWGDSGARFHDYTPMKVYLRLLNLIMLPPRGVERPALEGAHRHRIYPPGYVAGHSQAIVVLHKEIELLSRGRFPVLVTGETGVGKEHVAHLLHAWSPRSRGPFVAVNCAAIPNELWEAEVFGVTKGAATGVAEREGYFQRADGGTLLLDEVGELALPHQAKLLRVLQDHVVPRVGGSHVAVDVRVVAATNNVLSQRLMDRSFRLDLYYRLAGVVLHVPALRERKGDLSLLFHHFLRIHCREAGKRVEGVTLEAFELLSSYGWPGNVRELEHEVRRLIYLCPEGGAITPDLLPEKIARTELRDPLEDWGEDLNLERRTEEIERRLISQALEQAGWNRTQAARLLGVTRPGLTMKMERLGIEKSNPAGAG